MDKKMVMAIEVDGYYYHKKGTKQSERDKLKNNILSKYKIPLVRLKTIGSGEEKILERLQRAKEEIKFFNPTSAKNVEIVDQKLANRIDDLKILTAKDNTQETCFRVLEEIEAYIIQRKKEQQG